jgi:AcrR family transcriptional regulator
LGAETTRERIMDAADRLFGSHGFSGTSLRALTREAGVNLAAVNYHFGTKHELLRATLSRHLGAINAARLERLEALERRHPDGAIELRELVAALIRPAFEFSHASRENAEVIQRVSALLHSEPLDLLQPVLEEIFGEVSRRFERALARTLPDLPGEEVSLRLGFGIGCMVGQLAGRNPPTLDNPALSDGERVDHLVHFLAAGLSAPALTEARGRAE